MTSRTGTYGDRQAGKFRQFIAGRLTAQPEFGLSPVAYIDSFPLELEAGVGLPGLDSNIPPGDRRTLNGDVVDQFEGHAIVAFSRERPKLEPHLLHMFSQRHLDLAGAEDV